MTRDAQGYITVVDRIKDVINTGGILVASREVEDALYTHPGVAEVAVIGVPDEKWIEAVTAVVVLRDDADPDVVTAQVLVDHVRDRIAPFKVPSEFASSRRCLATRAASCSSVSCVPSSTRCDPAQVTS